MTAHLDTPAAMKLLVEQVESAALATHLQSDEVVDIVASRLLHTGMHCAANRHPDDIDRAAVGVVLDAITQVDSCGVLLTAAALPGRPGRTTPASWRSPAASEWTR